MKRRTVKEAFLIVATLLFCYISSYAFVYPLNGLSLFLSDHTLSKPSRISPVLRGVFEPIFRPAKSVDEHFRVYRPMMNRLEGEWQSNGHSIIIERSGECHIRTPNISGDFKLEISREWRSFCFKFHSKGNQHIAFVTPDNKKPGRIDFWILREVDDSTYEVVSRTLIAKKNKTGTDR